MNNTEPPYGRNDFRLQLFIELYSGMRMGQHALRHTFATRCIEAGIPPVVLKKWLGHTDIHVTLDTYTDVFSEMNNDAIN